MIMIEIFKTVFNFGSKFIVVYNTTANVSLHAYSPGGFFSSIFSSLFGTREMRILILGLDGAGKTTILYRLQVGEVVTTIPSMYLSCAIFSVFSILV